MLHKARGAPRLRALGGVPVLGVEVQPKELLLGAVGAPWEEEGGVGSDGVWISFVQIIFM